MLIALVVILCNLPMDASVWAADEFDTLRQRWLERLTGGAYDEGSEVAAAKGRDI